MTNAEVLKEYVTALRAADPKRDGDFHSLLNRGMELLKLLDKDIAHEFGASRPTVTRWRNGDNAPHPAMRKPVYAWLERRVASLLRREKRSRATGSSSSIPTTPIPAVARSR